MSLNESFFVSEKLHEKTVTLPDGSDHILHFREVPAPVFIRFREQQRSEDETTRAHAVANLLAASLCEPDGKPAITVEQALKLNVSAAQALMNAVMEVNVFQGKKPSPSEAESGSSSS
jgi:hypothetical protein